MQRNNAARVVVGNIPDYMDVDQLKPLFEEVGPVKSFELIYHANTQPGKKPRHRGFGFCEYFDESSKEAAVKNLGQRPVSGVYLRVRAADGGKEQAIRAAETAAKETPRLELEATTPIAMHLRELSLAEVYEAMEQMKQLVLDDEEKAKRILTSNPQLGMAMLHIFFYMGIVRNDPEREQEASMKNREKRAQQRQQQAQSRKRPREDDPRGPQETSSSLSPPPQPKRDPVQESVMAQLAVLSPEEIRDLVNLDSSMLEALDEAEAKQIIATQKFVRQNADKYLK